MKNTLKTSLLSASLLTTGGLSADTSNTIVGTSATIELLIIDDSMVYTLPHEALTIIRNQSADTKKFNMHCKIVKEKIYQKIETSIVIEGIEVNYRAESSTYAPTNAYVLHVLERGSEGVDIGGLIVESRPINGNYIEGVMKSPNCDGSDIIQKL